MHKKLTSIVSKTIALFTRHEDFPSCKVHSTASVYTRQWFWRKMSMSFHCYLWLNSEHFVNKGKIFKRIVLIKSIFSISFERKPFPLWLNEIDHLTSVVVPSPTCSKPVSQTVERCKPREAGLVTCRHSFSQQGVWVSFGHPNPLISPFSTP